MSLIAVGINHKTAPVTLRERVAFDPQNIPSALLEVTALQDISEAAILSTCNRTELYCQLQQGDANAVIQWLADYHHLSLDELQDYLYVHPDQDAVRHMLRVGSGLDSMILGEPQILGQLKQSFNQANDSGTLGSMLNRLFQHTFTVSKQVRTDTAIGASPVSIAFAAVSLAKQIFGELNQQTAMLIGAGETIELVARHLADHNIGRLIVANRTAQRAHDLAVQFSGYAIALDELSSHLAEADIIISSTASSTPVVSEQLIRQCLRKRKHKPVFIVDIAVPRDVEPAVGELDDVYLYTVDNLQDIIQENLSSRQEAAEQAEEIVAAQTLQFMDWVHSLDAVDTIRAIRENAQHNQAAVLSKAQQMLKKGASAEEVLKYTAHTLTNKFLHSPSSHLRQAGSKKRTHLIEAARELFGLKK